MDIDSWLDKQKHFLKVNSIQSSFKNTIVNKNFETEYDKINSDE